LLIVGGGRYSIRGIVHLLDREQSYAPYRALSAVRPGDTMVLHQQTTRHQENFLSLSCILKSVIQLLPGGVAAYQSVQLSLVSSEAKQDWPLTRDLPS